MYVLSHLSAFFYLLKMSILTYLVLSFLMFVSKLTCLTYLTHLTYPSRSFVKTLIWQAEWRSCGFDARQISSLWRILYSHCKSQIISYKFDIRINNLKFSSYKLTLTSHRLKSTLTSHRLQVAKYNSQNTSRKIQVTKYKSQNISHKIQKIEAKKSKLKIQASWFNQMSQATSVKLQVTNLHVWKLQVTILIR